jgi:hypothetical protein
VTVAPLPQVPRHLRPVAVGAPNRALLLGGVLGGLLLLAGSSIGLALLFSGGAGKAKEPDKTTQFLPGDKPAPQAEPRRVERPPIQAEPQPEPIVVLPPPKPALPPELQAKVDASLTKGVDYLRKSQSPDGGWGGGGHALGYTALPALTLLECGVPAADAAVQRAAARVRNLAASNFATYEIALAILFLDKLGEAQDQSLIQVLGARLIAGQTAAGGWTYGCPLVRTDVEAKSLLAALVETRPLSSRELLLTESGGGSVGSKGTDAAGTGSKSRPSGRNDAEKPVAVDDATFNRALAALPARMRNVPALKPPTQAALPDFDQSDNSNTQFGLLGVWVAGRHGVPTERALALVARRFRASQNTNGTWDYQFHKRRQSPGTPPMTAVGLLGLAVGHGLDTPERGEPRKKVEDPDINKGLSIFGQFVEDPKTMGERDPRGGLRRNYYFLWSVERVGVLYDAKTFADRDWYQWASTVLTRQQNPDGSWSGGTYHQAHPHLDSSFALLCLKRANLVKDLSAKVEFIIDSTK